MLAAAAPPHHLPRPVTSVPHSSRLFPAKAAKSVAFAGQTMCRRRSVRIARASAERSQGDAAPAGEQQQQQQQLGAGAEAAAEAPRGGAAASTVPAPADIECVGTGMEVTCTVPDNWSEERGAPASTSTNGAASGFGVAAAAGAAGAGDTPVWRKAADLVLLVSPFFFWGSSMVAMKVLGPHTSPLFVGAFRLVPAGAALVAWAAASGRAQPSGGMAWLAISVFALFDGAFFQGFLAEGLQRTTAGLGSIIIDSQPITVALLASLFLEERLKAWGYGGLALGVLGLLLLELPPETLAGGLPGLQEYIGSIAASGGGGGIAGGAGGGSLWDSGEWWMLLAAQSMAVGTVLVPWVSRYVDPVMATGWHLVIGGLPLAALAAAQEGAVLAERLPLLTGLDAALLLYVSLLGSAASYGVFFYNASRGNLTALSSLTFLTPCFAAGLGFLLLGETLTPLQLAGGAVTLAAVTVVNNNHAPSAASGSDAPGKDGGSGSVKQE